MIRIAAVGDVHFAADAVGTLKPCWDEVHDDADVFLLAGDLTRMGTPDEAQALAEELSGVRVPMVAVLGNHDYHSDQEKQVVEVLEDAGIRVLEGESTVVELPGGRLGVAGVKGFGTGFPGASASDFGEPEIKAFVRHGRVAGEQLREALEELDAERKVALMHYAPVPDTLRGERLEIHPFLGSYFLGEAVDDGGAELAIHGHAHAGVEKGTTPGGVHVRNVAQAVIRCAYKVYCLD